MAMALKGGRKPLANEQYRSPPLRRDVLERDTEATLAEVSVFPARRYLETEATYPSEDAVEGMGRPDKETGRAFIIKRDFARVDLGNRIPGRSDDTA